MSSQLFKVIAHRGDSAEAPENTLAAFRKAVALGVDFIECDVQLSKDKVPFVIHDRTFLRITAGAQEHRVDQLNREDIEKLDAGMWFDEKFSGEKIPTLEELLLMPKGNVGMMVEVKEETMWECGLALHVGNVLKRTSGHGRVLIGSLSPNLLMCFRGYLPEQKLIAIIESEEKLREFQEVKTATMALHYSLLTPTRIQEYQDSGVEVWAWTVDDKAIAQVLIHAGIDGIITNVPKKILSLCPHRQKFVAML